MTEAEWERATDPSSMLGLLRGKASDRKLRLFACACCRRIWHDLRDPRSRRAVEVAERYADGLASDDELGAASDAACALWDEEGRARPERLTYTSSAAAYNATIPAGWWGGAPAFVTPDEVIRRVAPDPGSEGAAQCALIRDIFGNPFRPVFADPAWLTPDVVTLARGIHTEGAYDRLPALAVALTAAGCRQEDILSHCRSGRSHVPGCWVVDLLLGRA